MTDVEVAILDARGNVVRHLAAGVLGGESPPPSPLKAGLSQSLEWDGKDDFGSPVGDPAALTVRVRAGMGVLLERVAGGDPYAFYSRQMGQGDHAAWKITGMDVKPDGSVYVMGNANNYGPPAIRQYSADGIYQCTVYPPPASKPVEEMKGWGINFRADGTYTPGYSDLSSPALSRTLIAGTRGECAFLIRTPEKDQLLLVNRRSHPLQLLRIKTDGTLPPDMPACGQFVNEPSLIHPEKNGWKVPWRVKGPAFTAFSPDGKHFYLSGLYATTQKLGREVGTEKMGFWRDGQVWKVDVATRKATVFLALDERDVITDREARVKSTIANVWYCDYGYAAFHGIAADTEGNVLVGDRQNRRVVALDKAGKVIREFPVMYPDALAFLPGTKTLYVTTRARDHHSKGEVKLLKFGDWTKDTEPAASVLVCPSYGYSPNTFLGVARSKGENLAWVAYTPLPVRVYRDKGNAFQLVKDFYEAGPQRALDLQHIVVDPKTEHVYVSDGWGSCFRVTDWKSPQFVRCMQDAKTPLRALSLAVEAPGRHLYGHSARQPVARYRLDGEFFSPAPAGGAGENAFTPKISNDWRIGLGFGDRGIAAAPDGSLATLGAQGTGAGYSGLLHFYKADPATTPWAPLVFKEFGEKPRSGGIRFDLKGNLYVGKYDGAPRNPPAGLEKDAHFLASTGRIYRYAPTGTMGNLFPTEPAAPAKIYDIHYGPLGPVFSRTTRFGVDGWGRIYYPSGLEPKVSVIDNEGNPVLSFGTYGNRDSMGGLPGDLVPTKDIPMAWPNSVDATDDYIYVGDLVNIRLLRIRKTFQLDSSRP